MKRLLNFNPVRDTLELIDYDEKTGQCNILASVQYANVAGMDQEEIKNFLLEQWEKQ